MSIPIRNKRTDISSEVARGRELEKKIKTLAHDISTESIEDGVDLDILIARVAEREGFNRLKIQRLVEESNTVAYNMRYDKLRSSHDRRITFPLASLKGVVDAMGDKAPPVEDNPNLAKGEKGTGNMAKAASLSIEPSPIHTPFSRAKENYEAYQEKVASQQDKQKQKELAQLERERKSTLFKIANCLVMSERRYKNANELYNTLLDDVPLSQEDMNDLKKTASDLASTLSKRPHHLRQFMVTLEENPTEKVANRILGTHSLLKEAEDQLKTKKINVQPTVDVTDFSDLINLARKLEAQQKQQQLINPSINEVN